MCDGVLIYYGAGNEMWLRRKLREVQKSAGYGRDAADAGRRHLRRAARCPRPRRSSARARPWSSPQPEGVRSGGAAAVRHADEGRRAESGADDAGRRPIQPVSGPATVRARRGPPVLRPRAADRRRPAPPAGHARFLAVVGASGSGKSSLVRSGLVPSLHSGFMVQAGSSWRVAVFRPGEDPIGHMAAALDDRERAGSARASWARRAASCSRPPCGASAHGPRRGGPPGVAARGRERPAHRRPVRGAVPVQPQSPHPQLARRVDRVRQAAAAGGAADGGADLRRPDDAVGLHRRLHVVPGPARGRQRRPVPRAAHVARRVAIGDHRARRRGRRRDRAAAGHAAAQRRRRRSGPAARAAARADADVGPLGARRPGGPADRHRRLRGRSAR